LRLVFFNKLKQMNFKKLNNITGWLVCAIACTVYILTAEAGGSLWDCGEFVSCAFKLQNPHPPGAPLFVLLGRFFIILFGDNPNNAAHAVNIMSALASGFCILFLFWTITHFARRIMKIDTTATLTTAQSFTIMGAGVVGGLAYTFSDSFWFSAVEGEVYALSSFFTAIVFWAILKWESAVEDNQRDTTGATIPADRWLIFLFFMMGLSIGVHILNLTAIPAIVMVYYLKKKDSFNYKVIRKWFIWLVIGGGILGMIAMFMGASAEEAILSKRYGGSDLVLSDTTTVALVLVGALLAIGMLSLIEAFNKTKKELYGGMFIFFVFSVVILGVVQIGVIQYTIKMAGAFDKIFVNNFSLPFFSGFAFFFVALIVAIVYGLSFAKKKGWQYLRLSLWGFVFILIGYSAYLTTMIRSSANTPVDMYNVDNPLSLVGYLGRDQYGDFPLLYGQKFTAQPAEFIVTGEKFQKSTDGYKFIGKDRKYVYLPKDKMAFPRVWDASNDQYHADYYAQFLGINQSQEKGKRYDDEDGRRPSQADNIKFMMGYQMYWMYLRYFMWNFSGKQNDIQGVSLGNVRDGNWITGIPFVDEIFYGSQSAIPDTMKNNKANNKLFALPLILGLLGLFYHYKKKGDDAFVTFLLFFLTGFAINIYLNPAGNQPRERDYAYVGSFYAFAIWIGLGVMAVSDFLQKRLSGALAPALATGLCFLAVPTIMAQQEWDDHDRSNKTTAKDLAKNYLESCPKNAILFSFGDNDTYPLWYAQEVENIRPDIRVINYSLLGIDWYVNQLRYKVNESDPIDVIWDASQIEGQKRERVTFAANAAFAADKYYDLYDVMKNYVGKDDKDKTQDEGEGEVGNTIPTLKFTVPVDKATIAADPSYNTKDTAISELKFDCSKTSLFKNDLTVLNVLAANKWKRPICFTSFFAGREGLGFDKYLRKEGLAYRIVPFENSELNAEGMLDKMLTKFTFGNCDKKGVYFDEENRRHLLGIRGAYAELANYLSSKNRKEDAKKVLDRIDKVMLQDNLPYGLVSRGNMHNRTSLMLLDACYRAEHKELIAKISGLMKKEFNQEIAYYNSLSGNNADNMAQEKDEAQKYLASLAQMEQMFNNIQKQNVIDTTKKQ
jgi:Protein of unknown function (DUF2723)